MRESTRDSEVLVCGILLCKNLHSKYVSTTLGLFSSWVSCLVLVCWLPPITILYLAVFCLFLSHRYYVCVVVLIYFLPLLIMGCAYLVVGYTLWASEIPGDSSDRYREQLTAKRKVIICRVTHIKA